MRDRGLFMGWDGCGQKTEYNNKLWWCLRLKFRPSNRSFNKNDITNVIVNERLEHFDRYRESC